MRRFLVLAALLFAPPALAGFDSAYTDLKFDDSSQCTNLTPAPVEGEPNDGAVYECKGFEKYVVSFSEGDLRSTVSFGTHSGDHCAASQTFGGFNGVGNRIEWRLKDGKPIATILRWTVSYDPEESSKTKTWLVVTKLEDNNSCHMGYVEGSYPKANEKARWLADTAATAFTCKVGIPIYFANAGTVTDGIASSGPCAQ
jgi:hypothetical protein